MRTDCCRLRTLPDWVGLQLLLWRRGSADSFRRGAGLDGERASSSGVSLCAAGVRFFPERGYLYGEPSLALLGEPFERDSEVDRLGLFGPALEDKGAVGAAEAEGVGERVVDLRGLGLVGHVVEPALGVELDDVHGRGNDLVLQGHDGDASFETTRAAEEMAGHGFGGTDEELVA